MFWVLFASLAFLFASAAGIAAGYKSGEQEFQSLDATQGALSLQEQFDLGLKELQAGEVDLARQRFEFVLERDPAFPGAAEKLAETLGILNATATPTPLPPTPTLTPTPDLRPVQDLFTQAQAFFSSSDWTGAIDTLVNLRNLDPAYRVTEVDGLLYMSLRSRGIQKIRNESNLEGGIYDLALAERFGPLDTDAVAIRDLARLYMFGSSFWEAYPEQAVYYFSQVAAAAPGLRDASGWTASERYRAALLQYADQLARQEDWCSALAQYEQALSMGNGPAAPTVSYAEEQCYTPTPEPTRTETPFPTFTETSLPSVTPAPPTNTPTQEPSSTEPLPPTETPTPEVTAPPADTPTPEVTAPPAETPTPEVTEPPVESPPPQTTEPPVVTTAPVTTEAPTSPTGPVSTDSLLPVTATVVTEPAP